MNIFITGSTGLIGRTLCDRFAGLGHNLWVWTTDVARASARLGPQVQVVALDCDDATLRAKLEGCDAVINLAGSSVVTRWTAHARRRLRQSRVDLTQRLVSAMRRCQTPQAENNSTERSESVHHASR